MQGPAGVLCHDLDMTVEHHPVARLWLVAGAERVPAVMGPRVLDDRDHARRRRVGIDADICPFVQWPRVGGSSGDPAFLADRVRAQRERHAGESCA